MGEFNIKNSSVNQINDSGTNISLSSTQVQPSGLMPAQKLPSPDRFREQASIDQTKITGPEFVIIDGVSGDGIQSDSEYFIGRDGPDLPLRWGIPLSARGAKGIGIDRLIERGLAGVDGKWIIINRPACIALRKKILNDPEAGLLGRLLTMLVLRAGDKPGEMIDPDGIYGALGIGNRAFILTKTLEDRGLITRHPQHQKITGANFALVVSDEARQIVSSKDSLKKTGEAWMVLFLASDPTNEGRLRLSAEIRDIEHRLALGKHAEVRITAKAAVRPDDLTQAIFDVKPQIVHFSGHGSSSGELCLEDANGASYPLGVDALTSLFELFSTSIRCVVLNACHSETQARAIAKHIPYVVGMKDSIGDDAAIVFATGFYKAIAGGESIPRAFEFGKVEMKLCGIAAHEHQTPVLIERSVT